MTKDELITKQQLEIEELKQAINERDEICRDARMYLNHAEQWSPKCHEFPRVAMNAIVKARNAIDSI